MEIAEIYVNGVTAVASKVKKIPKGIIGATIRVTFANDWADLAKTAVFQGVVTKDVLVDGNSITIPAECVDTPGHRLRVGFYGVAGDTLVIPTIWKDLGMIQDATDPSGDESTDPTLPIWAQLQEQIERVGSGDEEQIGKAVEKYLDKHPVEVPDVEIPTKVSAFENDSGYLTEHQDLSGYAKKEDIPSLDGYAKTADLPSALPNPNALTFTGAVQATYDGSKPMSVEIPQGGGGDSPWRKITDFTTEEEVATLFITQDDEGKTFKLKEIYFYVNALANSEGKTTSYFRFGVNPKNQHDCIWQTATGLPQTGFRWAQAVLALVGDVWVAQNTRTQINTASTFGGGYESNLSKSTPITTPAECVTFNFMGNIGVGSQIVIYGRDAA